MPKRRQFAHVALPLPIEHPFTYKVPKPLQHRAVIGMRVIVPFRNSTQTGYIVNLTTATTQTKLKDIVDLPDLNPIIAPAMLELCQWMADYYCCSIGEALHAAVPAGITVRTKTRYTLNTDQISSGRFTDRQRKIITHLFNKGPSTDAQLAKVIGKTALSNTLNSLTKRGILSPEILPPHIAHAVRTETYVTLNEDNILDPQTLATLQRRAPKQAALYLDLLHNPGETPASALTKKHGTTHTTLRALETKNLITLRQQEIYRSPQIQADQYPAPKHTLNTEQQQAYQAITHTLDQNKYATFLLQGITGSGKTEVYLQAIQHTLDQGRDAILLVPEISLTPQTVGRFIARFDTQIAVLHSGLAPGERYDEWRRAQRGEVKIVVGARSAIFAPLPDPGIIIVDEEHDTSYKQNESPRYHARDLAIIRAQKNNAVCILGSATPSIESYYNSEQKKSTRLLLPKRATVSGLPHIHLVDMRIETKELSGAVILSRPLEAAITQRVDNNEQVILLLNRRGHSPFVLCPKCSWTATCDNCQVTLTYHAKGAHLLCHYCNTPRPVPHACDECAFHPLIFLGTGDQKAEDYLTRTFPHTTIERMDADTTNTRGAHAEILNRFAKKEIDILIGTQMLAKGHDYPGVTLVGVINADTALAIPDFRAAEQTFQLITQVAGRAGRGHKPGEVIVQTYRPNHYAIQAALHHDYETFYSTEIKHRQNTAYPPYRRIVNLRIESPDPLLAEQHTAALHRHLREQRDALGYQGLEILGPAPATIRRIKKQYRWNIALLSKSTKRLNTLARQTRHAYHQHHHTPNVTLKIDFDPYNTF